jgi:tRNA threonylcarbamoyladenosine biosynthesis protein TsaE
MAVINISLPTLAATKRLGVFLANILRTGDVIALNGPLGAGKSELARAIIADQNPDELDIPSPTFTLVQTYEMADGTPLLHFDMYRLDAPEEARELGVEDAFYDGVSIVEWPDRIGGYLPSNALHCTLAILPDGGREMTIEVSPQWQARLDGITQL